MRAELSFNPAKALTTGSRVKRINLVEKFKLDQKPTPQAFFSNPASMAQKVRDTYSPSSKSKDTPLTLYKFNAATKSIKKIKIID